MPEPATKKEHRIDPQIELRDRLREEAAREPDPVPDGELAKETQIIAIYGKGGIGKSFTLSNLSYMMAQQGKKVLLIGCDPKSDTTSLLFGGKSCPTIIETSSKKKASGEEVAIGDVCFKRDGVFAMELGGPEVGRGCGGRGPASPPTTTIRPTSTGAATTTSGSSTTILAWMDTAAFSTCPREVMRSTCWISRVKRRSSEGTVGHG